MPDLFADLDREERYTDRLAKLLADGRKALTAADFRAVRTLLEERARLRADLVTVRKMRQAQAFRDKAQQRGVSREQGLEQAIHAAGHLERVVDGRIREEVGDADS